MNPVSDWATVLGLGKGAAGDRSLAMDGVRGLAVLIVLRLFGIKS